MLRPYLYKTKTEAGVDEAGRGCYAGPVFAAAVILPKDFYCIFNAFDNLVCRKSNDLPVENIN